VCDLWVALRRPTGRQKGVVGGLVATCRYLLLWYSLARGDLVDLPDVRVGGGKNLALVGHFILSRPFLVTAGASCTCSMLNHQ